MSFQRRHTKNRIHVLREFMPYAKETAHTICGGQCLCDVQQISIIKHSSQWESKIDIKLI